MGFRDNIYGMVVCGGESSRMGTDKAFLVYHELPQCYHVANMLSNADYRLCTEVTISCNNLQFDFISNEYNPMADLPEYANCGPIASLLTAFSTYPDKNFLVIGCDYPYIQTTDIVEFLDSIRGDSLAAAFYNKEEKYEPLLAWYAADAGILLKSYFEKGGRSLQRFLTEVSAQKYIPTKEAIMTSVDTPEQFASAKFTLMKE